MDTDTTTQIIVLTGVLLSVAAVLMVPAAVTEIRNTRTRPPVPLRPLGDVIPDDVPIPPAPVAGVHKRRVTAGRLDQFREGPLAWIWEPLSPAKYPLRRADDGRLVSPFR
jgi:hypothetical protein